MSSKTLIIQVSDPHLFGDKNREINGSNSYVSLKNVLESVFKLKDKPDFIVLTGDLSQDCTFESYQYLKNLLSRSNIKYFLLPGNHDDVDVLNKVFDFNWIKDNVDYCWTYNGWFFYSIDTSFYPYAYGKISDAQLATFQSVLNLNKNLPTIVFMHHHPILINSLWMDKTIVKDAEKFNSIVKTNTQIKAVLFGHVHQNFEKIINDVFYASSPSSCFQVLANSEMFTVEKLIPGYRIIELNDNNFSSNVVWVE